MVYMDGDNDLESAAIADFLEVADVGSTAAVRVVALFDRKPGEDDSYGNWTDTRRGLISAGDAPDATWGESIGEANMGDAQTVIDFAEWAVAAYPAERYAIVFWNHGSGWWPARTRSVVHTRAVCYDDTDGEDALSVGELRTALAAITADNGRLALLGFDACLMGMVEVAYELRQYATVMLGAEGDVVGEGWTYDTVLAQLTASPTMSATQLGTTVVDDYLDYVRLAYAGSDGDPLTYAAIDLDEIGTLATAVNSLAQALRQPSADSDAVAPAAQEVKSAIQAAVIHEQHSPQNAAAHGLTIYFPASIDGFSYGYDATELQFAGATQWDEFLEDFFTAASPWTAPLRADAEDFYDALHVDLYDFCDRIVASSDLDTDGDGVPDYSDNCPATANADQADDDGDGAGDACDDDADNDGTPDADDGCPDDSDKTSPGQCGCGVSDADTDADGALDCHDDCPLDPAKIASGLCGCDVADDDSDEDGAPDCLDDCPADPAKTAPGGCGCGQPDVDDDGDAVADCLDECPDDPGKSLPGVCGCGVSDADADANGWPDCLDGRDSAGTNGVLALNLQDSPSSGLCGAGAVGLIVPLSLAFCRRSRRVR